MKETPFEPGQAVKVIQLSGKIAREYLTKPGKEGTLRRVEGDKGLVRFKRDPGKNCRIYYRHDHWIYLKDLRIIRKRNNGGS